METKKGKVTPIASIFSEEEAQKASKWAQDSISDHQKKLETIRLFVTENTNLINLVQKLPEEISHNIMVPFGKAAFFPGRLIHTNEFIVLLGEGYYVERSSKQTIEILQRRGKTLDSQVDSLKATISDLQAEASFFDNTYAEAVEGLMEIREEYVEDFSEERDQVSGIKPEMLGSSATRSVNISTEDEEYARIMARMDELEMEESANRSLSEDDEEENDNTKSKFSIPMPDTTNDNMRKISEDNEAKNKFPGPTSQNTLDNGASTKSHPSTSKAFAGHPKITPMDSHDAEDYVEALGSSFNMGAARKAFTGSVVEHNGDNLLSSGQRSSPQQKTATNASKPVSRFKKQKDGS